MIEKEQFIRPLNIEIYVSTIGINKDDWYCYKPGMTHDEVRQTMLSKGFDVVPIINKSGVVKKYFTLDKDLNRLISKNIKTEDKLYYLTHVRDAIWKMKTCDKPHYFLTNGRNGNDVVGLLSLSNFNSREFYVYLFSFLSYVEREFANLIESNSELGFQILADLSDKKNQLKNIQNRIREDKKKEIENDYKEYLYLHHLILLIKSEKKYEKLGYSTEESFDSGTIGFNDFRNNIAHPVKSLVRTLNDLDNLETWLNKLYEFKERLDHHLEK
jgi:hypothetical protein